MEEGGNEDVQTLQIANFERPATLNFALNNADEFYILYFYKTQIWPMVKRYFGRGMNAVQYEQGILIMFK